MIDIKYMPIAELMKLDGEKYDEQFGYIQNDIRRQAYLNITAIWEKEGNLFEWNCVYEKHVDREFDRLTELWGHQGWDNENKRQQST